MRKEKKEFSRQRVAACQETTKRVLLQGSRGFSFLTRHTVAEKERQRDGERKGFARICLMAATQTGEER